jgi:hypothetical protein
MNDPRVTALVSGVAAILLAWRIFGGGEAVSPLLGTIQWVLFAAALVGVVGSLVQMGKK